MYGSFGLKVAGIIILHGNYESFDLWLQRFQPGIRPGRTLDQYAHHVLDDPEYVQRMALWKQEKQEKGVWR